MKKKILKLLIVVSITTIYCSCSKKNCYDKTTQFDSENYHNSIRDQIISDIKQNKL